MYRASCITHQYNRYMSWVMWITGLPGSGKSTVALKVKENVPDTIILRMDILRKIVTPEPTYSDEEREYVYRAIVYTAKTVYDLGHNVIIDATGNRRFWRQLARKSIPDFFEVYVKCPLELCREREQSRVDTHDAPAKIYEKGETGSPVPGMNVPYEEPEAPDLTVNTEKESPENAVERIIRLVQK